MTTFLSGYFFCLEISNYFLQNWN